MNMRNLIFLIALPLFGMQPSKKSISSAGLTGLTHVSSESQARTMYEQLKDKDDRDRYADGREQLLRACSILGNNMHSRTWRDSEERKAYHAMRAELEADQTLIKEHSYSYRRHPLLRVNSLQDVWSFGKPQEHVKRRKPNTCLPEFVRHDCIATYQALQKAIARNTQHYMEICGIKIELQPLACGFIDTSREALQRRNDLAEALSKKEIAYKAHREQILLLALRMKRDLQELEGEKFKTSNTILQADITKHLPEFTPGSLARPIAQWLDFEEKRCEATKEAENLTAFHQSAAQQNVTIRECGESIEWLTSLLATTFGDNLAYGWLESFASRPTDPDDVLDTDAEAETFEEITEPLAETLDIMALENAMKDSGSRPPSRESIDALRVSQFANIGVDEW